MCCRNTNDVFVQIVLLSRFSVTGFIFHCLLSWKVVNTFYDCCLHMDHIPVFIKHRTLNNKHHSTTQVSLPGFLYSTKSNPADSLPRFAAGNLTSQNLVCNKILAMSQLISVMSQYLVLRRQFWATSQTLYHVTNTRV